MAPEKITINEVAREAGVSIATVSRYLTSPISIKKENRSRVEQAIKSLHYKPYVYARKLAGGKLGVFGLVIPGYEGIFYSFYALEILRGMGFELKNINKDLYLHIYWGEDRLNSSLVDGIIFADVLENERQLKRILKEKIPCVVINKKTDDLEVSYVAIDNFKGAYRATEHLIKQGHTKIAHIAGDLRVESAQERLSGYRKALSDHKLNVRDNFMKEAHFSRPEARRVVEELFSQSEVPTAIFAGSDDMALEVFHFAQKENIKFPEDLSLIGFDDNPLCMYENLELTTVRQPIREMVSVAVDILKKTVDKKEGIVKKMLEPELVIRKSVSAV
ncbi:MAG: LacI family DNA-binding transcriptional regulator [Candidatus Omnitrophica bacterium]|nr:LacI family DNA-binding transcriptional regulator [Candidatus Omnitrophota bacterium]